MKNILYLLIMVCSLNTQAQNEQSIEKDDLFLQYKENYIDFKEQDYYRAYETSINNFVKGLTTSKDNVDFRKAKDKERWLKKNISKTRFESFEIALKNYNKMIESKETLRKKQEEIFKLRDELLSKYDRKLIFETLSKYEIAY